MVSFELVIWIKPAVGRNVRSIVQSNQPCAASGCCMNHRIVKTGSCSCHKPERVLHSRNSVTLEGAFPRNLASVILIPEFPDQTFEGSDRPDIFLPHTIISIVN
jgi:hypothetical protein